MDEPEPLNVESLSLQRFGELARYRDEYERLAGQYLAAGDIPLAAALAQAAAGYQSVLTLEQISTTLDGIADMLEELKKAKRT